MGNILWCCCKGSEVEDDEVDRYPYHHLTPRPHYYGEPAVPVVASRPPPVLPHGSTSTSRSSLLRFQPPPIPTSSSSSQLRPPPAPVPHGVASSASTSSLLRFQIPPAPGPRPQLRPQPPPAPVSHGVASSASTSSLRRFQTPPVPASRPQLRQHPPPAPVPRGVAALKRDLLNFQATSMVPQGLGEHVTSSKKAQTTWYRNILEAYSNTKPPPGTSAEAALLVATTLSRIKGANLEGVLAFYGFAIPTPPIVTSFHSPSLLPEGVQFVLNTLPVHTKCIGDGDGFTAYVDAADPMEPTDVPLELRDAVVAMAQARKCRKKNQKKNELRNRLNKAGYRIIRTSRDEILAKQYRFRLRGIDAPEMEMKYGKESQNALVKLIAGKSVMVYVYGQDKYERYVGDIYCDGVFIQEQMLKNGHAWHHKYYDKRLEFAKWEKEARDARRGLWVSDNPEKPWEWKRNNKSNARHKMIRTLPSAIPLVG